MLLVFVLFALQPALCVSVLHTSLVNELISSTGVFDGVLPLEVELVALLVQTFKFLCGFVKLNLGGLSLCNFLLEFIRLASHFHGQFFDLKSQLLDFGFISPAELLQSEVVFLLLSGGKRPLLQLLLVPVHLELKLVHAFVGLEDHVLDVVQAILLVRNSLLQLFDFVSEASALSLRDLFEMLFGFDLLVLRVDEGLSVHQLHLDGLEMFLEDLQPLLVLFNFEAKLGHKAHFLAHDLVQLFVLIVGIGWEVLVQVVLSDGVNDVVCHITLGF